MEKAGASSDEELRTNIADRPIYLLAYLFADGVNCRELDGFCLPSRGGQARSTFSSGGERSEIERRSRWYVRYMRLSKSLMPSLNDAADSLPLGRVSLGIDAWRLAKGTVPDNVEPSCVSEVYGDNQSWYHIERRNQHVPEWAMVSLASLPLRFHIRFPIAK